MGTRKLTELSLLTAVALMIFTVELQFPNLAPIPGMKLGLANIVTVYAVYHYSAKETVMIAVSRILLGALFSGRMTALFYSLAGGMFCLAGMLVLRHLICENYIWVSSILGAVLHNMGQITAAVLITGSIAVAAYLPVLLVTGCAAGLFTGLCAQMMIHRTFVMKTGN